MPLFLINFIIYYIYIIINQILEHQSYALNHLPNSNLGFLKNLKLTLNYTTIRLVITHIIFLALILSCSGDKSAKPIVDSSKKNMDSLEKDIFLKLNDTVSYGLEKKSTIETQKKKSPILKKPTSVDLFSIGNLGFTWEEINACDCIFKISTKNTIYEKLYFGRFKDNKMGILQFEKKTDKFQIPILKSRSKNRKPGSKWKETYQNDRFQITLKATPTRSRIKGKHTYFIDFTLIELSSKESIKKVILTNCRS